MNERVTSPSFDSFPDGRVSACHTVVANLHLITKCFVAGTVVRDIEGVEECASEVEVILEKDGKEIERAKTDIFGEFVIDKLEPKSGVYKLKILGVSEQFSTEFKLSDESVCRDWKR